MEKNEVGSSAFQTLPKSSPQTMMKSKKRKVTKMVKNSKLLKYDVINSSKQDLLESSRNSKNSYINGIKDLIKEYNIEDADFLTRRGLKELDLEDEKNTPLRKLKNRESAKNSRKRRKLYMELMERKIND